MALIRVAPLLFVGLRSERGWVFPQAGTHPFTSDLNSLHENSLFLKNICHAADVIHINQGVYLKGKTLSALLGGKKTWPNIST